MYTGFQWYGPYVDHSILFWEPQHSCFSLHSSLYLVLVGWRFASNRKGEVAVDTMLVQFGGLVELLWAWQYSLPHRVTLHSAYRNHSLQFPATFGIISLHIGLPATRYKLKEAIPEARRISLHVTYMGAGTISTVTAFTITVFGSIFTWLGATIIGTHCSFGTSWA